MKSQQVMDTSFTMYQSTSKCREAKGRRRRSEAFIEKVSFDLFEQFQISLNHYRLWFQTTTSLEVCSCAQVYQGFYSCNFQIWTKILDIFSFWQHCWRVHIGLAIYPKLSATSWVFLLLFIPLFYILFRPSFHSKFQLSIEMILIFP